MRMNIKILLLIALAVSLVPVTYALLESNDPDLMLYYTMEETSYIPNMVYGHETEYGLNVTPINVRCNVDISSKGLPELERSCEYFDGSPPGHSENSSQEMLTHINSLNRQSWTLAYWVQHTQASSTHSDIAWGDAGAGIRSEIQSYFKDDIDLNKIEVGYYYINTADFVKPNSQLSDYTNFYFVVVQSNATSRMVQIDNNVKLVSGRGDSGVGFNNLSLGQGFYIGDSMSSGVRVAHNLRGNVTGVSLWNRSLSSSELTDLYENGISIYGATPSNLLDIRLFDKDNASLSETALTETTLFYVGANYSDSDGNTIESGVCNFTGINISYHNAYESASNVTLTGSNQIDLVTKEEVTDILYDFYEFSVCKSNTDKDVLVYFNGTLHRTISGNVIPACGTGTSHYEANVTYAYITEISNNVSIQCPTCTPSNNIKVISDSNDHILVFQRTFSSHTEDMYYSEEDNLYRYDSHLYNFRFTETGNVTVLCNSSYDSFSESIADTGLNIKIAEIDNGTFSNGTSVESKPTFNILISLYGDIVSTFTFNVTYVNGTLAKSVASELMILTDSELPLDGIYNISIVAEDDEGNAFSQAGFFYVNDTTIPNIITTEPSPLNDSQLINTVPLPVYTLFTDTNLYYYWINITEKGSGTLVYNYSAQISGYTYIVNTTIDLRNESNSTYIMDIRVCDAHTMSVIPDATGVISRNNSLDFQFSDTLISIASTSGNEVRSYSEKKEDRYTFGFQYDRIYAIKSYILSANKDITYLPDSEYKGHFVIDKRYWVDFEGSSDVVVHKVNDTYRIDIVNAKTDVQFNSIGIINCKTQSILFSLSSEPSYYNINLLPSNFFNTEILDLYSTSGVLILIFLFLLLVSLIVFSEYVKIPAFTLFVSLYAFFFSFLVYVSITAILGVLLVIISLMYMIFRIITFM